MPRKDPEKRAEYQKKAGRLWYLRNRELTIARAKEFKRTHYIGTCVNCGGPTVGSSPSNIPKWCSQKECASLQRKPKGDQ